MTRPDSPCKGVCTTTYDEFCRACHRHYLEVANWSTMTQAEKDAVWLRIEILPNDATLQHPKAST